MSRLLKLSTVLLLFATAIGGAASAGAAEPAAPAPALDAWLAHQATIDAWSADVLQVRKLESLVRPLESRGKVWFRQPNRFRWQLGDPPRTVASRTERELMIVYPRLRQAERYPLEAELDASWEQVLALLEVGFPSDAESFYERYELVSATAVDDRWHFELRPAAVEARRLIESVLLEVQQDDHALLATELRFPGGSTMRNEFSAHDFEPELGDDFFEVDVDGYDIVDPLRDRGAKR